MADPANLDSAYTLVHSNVGYPLSFAASETVKTVYFFGDGLTPQAGPYVVTATVDYTGAIVEFDETNNDAWGTFNVVGTGWPPGSSPGLSIVYVKADWGATPESAFTTYFGNSSATFPMAFSPSSATHIFRLSSRMTDRAAYCRHRLARRGCTRERCRITTRSGAAAQPQAVRRPLWAKRHPTG